MAQPAPLDALAHLACPPVPKANRGAAALHAGQLLAYAAGAAVVVADAQSMSVATTLSGAHRQAAVTALAWHPGGGPREPRAAAQLRLASGDEEGRVMVWNVSTGAVIAALEDPWASAFGTAPGAKRPEPARPPVVGLAWATAAPSVLAVLLVPGMLLLWDYRTGSIAWRRDFGAAEAFTSLQARQLGRGGGVDPLDRRRLVLCGAQGSFVVLGLVNPAADRVRVQQYTVDIGGGGTLACAFAGTRDLLLLLLQREIIVFDLEYGQPAASTPLPPSRAPLEALLGAYGHAAVGRPACEGGVDVLYCSHRDGSLSVWQRHARLLTYSCLGAARLLPPATKFGAAPALAALAAGLWRGLSASGDAGRADLTTQASLASGGKRPPGMARRVSADLLSSQDLGSQGGGGAEGGWPGGDGDGAAGHSLLLMGASTDGQVWQWQVPLLAGTLAGPKAKELPPPPKPELLGLLHSLPQRVTAFCVGPAPVALPGSAGALVPLAAATAGGSLELAVVQQGALLPLHLCISVSLAAHPGPVQGLRWLGSTARLVSYSCEKASGGWRNTLLVTDVRNRVSLPFRQSAADPAPLAGVRASPSGRHLLLLFRGAPSEIWAVGAGAQPSRLRQVDLQFTAVEWLGPTAAESEAGAGGPWAASPRAAERAAAGYAFEREAATAAHDDAPEERLAFCLVDGRAGVLGVRGRRISDTRPRRPTWQALAAGDFRALALGSWGQSVVLGDAEGTLVHWDTTSGRCATLDTGHGRVHRILAAPAPAEAWYPRLPGSQAVAARLAVLFASGLVGVFDLDQQGDLWATHVTASAWAARVGRVTDAQWLTLPGPIGGGTVLAASLEDGSLALFDTVHTIDVRPRRTRMLRYHAMLHTPPAPGADPGQPWGLRAPPPTPAPPLLPRAWGLLLRLLLQRGLPEAVLRELGGLAASVQAANVGSGGAGRTLQVEQALERLEAEVWSRLPHGCQAAWEALLARRLDGQGEEPLSAPELRQLLDSCAADAEEEDEGQPAVSSADPAAAQRGGGAAVAPHAGSPSWEGSAVRDEAAAAALGLTGRQASGSAGSGSSGRRRGAAAATFKSLGGAFKGMAKDVASVGRSQLKSLAGGGRGPQPLVAAVAGISDGYEYSGPSGGIGFHSLVAALHAIATARGHPAVLSPAELGRYSAALGSHRVADRMALAAELLGDGEEARFWRRLPATLAWLAAALAQQQQPTRPPRGAAAPVVRSSIEGRPPLGGAGSSGALPATAAAAAAAAAAAPSGAAGSGGRRLWDEQLEMAEALERSAWHEQMSRGVFEGSEDLQEKRVLEYCSLGDFQTAVGFLLASPPDRSQRYYRDALCTLGMAFAAGLQQAALAGGNASAAAAAAAGQGEPGGAAAEDSAARTLFVQAAKVIAANAASVGDTLLGVPLLCSAGQHADAAGVLQDAGLWRYASALVAHALRDGERAAAMERWAGHVAAAEGRPWTAAGLLVAAGALKSALALLRQHGLPDAAAALVAACRDADLLQVGGSWQAPGELHNLFGGGAQGGRAIRYSSGDRPGERGGDASGTPSGDGQSPPAQVQRSAAALSDTERGETAREMQLYVAELLQQL